MSAHLLPPLPKSRPSRGVTLIELMVGLVIGLVATLVVAQVLNVAEGQKRSTTSGMDAQVNGALALYALQREISAAGYGLVTYKAALGCPLHGQYGGASKTWTLAPVLITDGGGAPDTIMTMASDGSSASLPAAVVENHTATGTEFLTATSVGIAAGEAIIAVPETIDAADWCSLLQVSSVTNDAAGHHIAHLSGASWPWNPAAPASLLPAAGYAAGGYLIDAGQLAWRKLQVNTATNTLQEFAATTATGAALPATGTDMYTGIVNLQALYGKDTDNDGTVDTYDKVTPTTAADWANVKTVRIAVVARSGQYEKEAVTGADPKWDLGMGITVANATSCGASQCLTLRVSNLPDWNHYRYKVYDATVPLRNVLWSQ